MAFRDLVVFLTVFSLVPLCVARPYIGVLTWAWVSYMNPHRLTWGAAYSFPFAQLVAVATVLGVIGMVLSGRKLPKMPWERETILLVLLWFIFLITTPFALRPDLAWPEFEKISKILIGTFLTILLIDDEKKMKYLLLVIVFSLGFYGVKGGIFSIVGGGQHRVFGPGGFIGGNNSLGLALNMVLPILFYLAQIEKNVWVRWVLRFTFVLTIISVIFTYSRGAWLGLATVLGLIALSFKFRTKVVIAIGLVLILPFAVSLVPQKVFDRADTITTYQEDGSAQARLRAWTTAWRVAVDKPLVGGGFQIIDDKELMRGYNLEYAEGRHAGVHSIVFEVMSENGFIALGIFLLLILSCMLSLRRLRRESSSSVLEGQYHYARMLEIGLAGYFVSGLFLEMASFDMLYQFVAFTIILKKISRNAVREQEVDGNAIAALKFREARSSS